MFSEMNLNVSATMFLLIVALFLWWLYRYYKIYFSYWKNRGVQYETPFPFLGNTTDVMLMKKSHFRIVDDLYTKFSGLRYFGMYKSVIPYLVVRDPNIVKDILVDRFDCFRHRGWAEAADIEPMLDTVYIMEGKSWETLRKELCTVFQKEKNPNIFGIVFKSAKKLTSSLWDTSIKSKDVEISEMFVRYSTDISGLYLLGLDLNSVEDFTSTIRNLHLLLCGVSWKAKLAQICLLFFPNWWKLFKVFQENRLQDFVLGFTKAIIKHREDKLVIRDDLLQSLIKLKDDKRTTNYIETSVNGKKSYSNVSNDTHVEVSNVMIAAHVLDFVVGGPEIISALMSCCAYELALNQDIQDNLRNEIDIVLRQTGGKFTYETIGRLKYMEQVLNETIRKYDTWPVERMCTKSYVVPGTSMMIEKGDRVIIPTYALRNDPKYFSNPDMFDPERFNEQNKHFIAPYTFMPFGEGPRNCISKDYTIIQFKVGIATLLMHYKLNLCKKTVVPLNLETTTFATIPDKGLWLQIEKR